MLTKIELDRLSNASSLQMENGVLGLVPALFKNDGLKFEMPERTLQLSRKLARAVSLMIESNDLPRKKPTIVVLRTKLRDSLSDIA